MLYHGEAYIIWPSTFQKNTMRLLIALQNKWFERKNENLGNCAHSHRSSSSYPKPNGWEPLCTVPACECGQLKWTHPSMRRWPACFRHSLFWIDLFVGHEFLQQLWDQLAMSRNVLLVVLLFSSFHPGLSTNGVTPSGSFPLDNGYQLGCYSCSTIFNSWNRQFPY